MRPGLDRFQMGVMVATTELHPSDPPWVPFANLGLVAVVGWWTFPALGRTDPDGARSLMRALCWGVTLFAFNHWWRAARLLFSIVLRDGLGLPGWFLHRYLVLLILVAACFCVSVLAAWGFAPLLPRPSAQGWVVLGIGLLWCHGFVSRLLDLRLVVQTALSRQYEDDLSGRPT